MRINWHDLGKARAGAADGTTVELYGFPVPPQPSWRSDHFLLVAEPACCPGCAPRDPLAAIEVFATAPLPMQAGALRLTGIWRNQGGAQAEPNHQVHAARLARSRQPCTDLRQGRELDIESFEIDEIDEIEEKVKV